VITTVAVDLDQLNFRVERSGEAAVVSDVVARSFGDQHVADLMDGLRASTAWIDGLSFVADLDGEVFGQVLFTRGILDAPRRLVEVLVLSPVGIVTEYRGQGIGSALIRHALGIVGQRSEPLVFLEGSPDYYPRFGFEAGGLHGFRRPSLRIPEPAFQVLRLPSHQAWMTGTLVYPQVFWDLDSVGLRDPNA